MPVDSSAGHNATGHTPGSVHLRSPCSTTQSGAPGSTPESPALGIEGSHWVCKIWWLTHNPNQLPVSSSIASIVINCQYRHQLPGAGRPCQPSCYAGLAGRRGHRDSGLAPMSGRPGEERLAEKIKVTILADGLEGLGVIKVDPELLME